MIVAMAVRNEELEDRLNNKDQRIAKLENRLKQVSSLCLVKGDLALVASGEETIMVDSALARSSSAYFDAALSSGLSESSECPKTLSFVCPRLPQLPALHAPACNLSHHA